MSQPWWPFGNGSLGKDMRTDLRMIVVIPIILGHCFHLSIRKVEIDFRILSLLGVYITLWIIITGLYVNLYHLRVLQAMTSASLQGLFFNIGLAASIVIYRLFFHRTRHFPGPFGAKLSRVYTVWLSSKSIQYHFELQKLHEKYGDFVRTGPREISILRPAAVYAIFGPQSQCRKATLYSQVTDDPSKTSIHLCRDPEQHRRRRRAWDRGLGMKALQSYEPKIRSKIDLLIKQLKARQNSPVNATAWSMFLAFDIMGAIGFSKDFHQLDDGCEHPAIKDLHTQMATLGLLSPVPWLLSLLTSLSDLTGQYSYYEFLNYCNRQVEEKKMIWESHKKEVPEDAFSWLLKSRDERDQSAPPTDQALLDDGRVIIIAGSDTTAVTLANILYYLVACPSVYQRLQKIVDRIFPEGDRAFDYDKIKNIPYLDAIINESLRLKPVIPSGQPRLTPPGGLQIDEVWIPGDTIVSVPQWIMFRDERYFVRATEFLPERWLEEKDRLVKDERAFFPFSLGPYSCAGKHVALMELRSVLTRIALNFDVSFAPGEDGIAFDKQTRDTFILVIDSLNLVFNDRQRN